MPRITVTTGATLLASGPVRRNAFTKKVMIKASADMYVGPTSAVTADDNDTTGGTLLLAGQIFEDELKNGQTVYGRVAAGTARAEVYEREVGP